MALTHPTNEAHWVPVWNRDPQSVYVHIPFCRHHCRYCNFSVVAGREDRIDRYLSGLELELARSATIPALAINTLFLGGGTPSRLNSEQLARLRSALDRYFRIAPQAEITIEANPSDLDSDWLQAACTNFGINRLSLGAQSFQAAKLRFLERDHSGDQIRRAVEMAHAANLNVSLDLIFAVPGETIADWTADLRSAIELSPHHVSTYELTFEKGTRLWNHRQHGLVREQTEDSRADFYRGAIDLLTASQYEHYEVSSFTRSGFACQHNQTYWSGRPYLAFGSGASRWIGGVRSTNHGSTWRYLQRLEAGQDPIASSSRLTAEETAREILAVGLRQLAGVSLAAFQQCTGFAAAQLLEGLLDELLEWQLLSIDEGTLRLTTRGLELYDSVAEKIAIATRDKP